ncbi:MAG: polysaccharide biosynthesis C-terminal domain-containing protein [Clostridia bacterium]|nr:polysaccharide biosynthesis C-terminal domain-containing protein [Clostridia bacterium]
MSRKKTTENPITTDLNRTGADAKLLRNTAVFTVGKFVSKLLVLFMTRLYTACLTTEEYGQADLITAAANLLIPLACLGIGEGIVRCVAGETTDFVRRECYFTAGLLVLLAGSVGLGLLSPLIALIPMFRETAWLIVVYVLVSNLHSIASQYLYACGKTGLFAGQGILNTLLTILLNILFLPVLHFGVVGYVSSVIIADGLTTVFLVVYTRLWNDVRRMPLSYFRPFIREMLGFSLMMIPTTICWWITSVSDRYMVSAMHSETENGLYTVAYKIPTLLTLATIVFDSAWKLSVAAEKDEDACTAFYTKVWRHYLTLSFVGGAVLILACRPISWLLVSPDFRASWVFVPVLTVATVFCSLDTFLGSVYFTKKKPIWSMITAICAASLNIALNWLLIPRMGAMGAALATLASYLIAFILRIATVRKLIPFDRRLGASVLNLTLLCLLTVAVTATDGQISFLPAGAAWAAGAVLCAAIIIINLRPLVSLVRDLAAALLHRGRE